RLVGEHGAADHVADGVDARRLGAEMPIGEHEAAAIHLDPRSVQSEPVRVRPPTSREQDPVAAERLLAVDLHDAAVAVATRGGHLGAEPELEPLLGEQLLRLLRDLRVHPWQDAVEVLDHRDLGAEPAPHGPELEPDVASADHHEMAGDLRISEGFRAGADAVPVELDAGQRGDLAARGDDDVLRRELGGALLTLDDERRPAREAPTPEVAGHLVLAEEEVDPVGQPRDDVVLALQHRRQVQLHRADLDPELPERVPGLVVTLAGLEERLARDAAHTQAGAAQRLLQLDAGRVQPELCGANGRDVTPWSGADDDEVVLLLAHDPHTSRRMRLGCSMHSLIRLRKVTASRPSTMR